MLKTILPVPADNSRRMRANLTAPFFGRFCQLRFTPRHHPSETRPVNTTAAHQAASVSVNSAPFQLFATTHTAPARTASARDTPAAQPRTVRTRPLNHAANRTRMARRQPAAFSRQSPFWCSKRAGSAPPRASPLCRRCETGVLHRAELRSGRPRDTRRRARPASCFPPTRGFKHDGAGPRAARARAATRSRGQHLQHGLLLGRPRAC